MPRRPEMTAVDYLAVAIAPALIIVLVASLVFALVAFGYQGEYPERLVFCLAMFALGSVCIARISIEISSEHAAVYGMTFAAVVGIAMVRFGGGPWWSSLGLMAIVWYCAHQLTWDSTIVDDTVDASGEGLLQTAGLDRAAQPKSRNPKPRSESRSRMARRAKKLAALTPPVDEGSTMARMRPTWRERWRAARQRPHAHGLWVVYFSLAALPIFGLGQLSIPTRDVGSRRLVFTLLFAYLAAALGLLLITSFLGLRRYLRQRRVVMPAKVVSAWAMVGVLIAAGVLVIAAMMPRPSPEYSLADVAQRLGLETRKQDASPTPESASATAVGGEGARDDSAADGQGVDSRDAEPPKGNGRQPSAPQQSGSEGDRSPATANEARPTPPPSSNAPDRTGQAAENRPSPANNSAAERSGEASSQDRDSGSSAAPDSSSDSSLSDSASAADRQSSSPQSDGATSSPPQRDEAPTPDSARAQSATDNASSSRSPPNDGAAADEKSKPPAGEPEESPSPDESPEPISISMSGGWLEWVVWFAYGVVALAFLYALWHFRSAIFESLRQFIESWKEFWLTLFRRKGAEDDDDEPAPRRLRPFASFSDPFANGAAADWTIRQLVRYSFEALEAWASERGAPRLPEQTPLEFVRAIGRRAPTLERSSKQLADAYNRTAYAPGTLGQESVRQLRQFWLDLDSCVMAAEGQVAARAIAD